MVVNYSSKHDVWNDTSSCLELSMVVDRVIRFGEGTFVIGCGNWNERESQNVSWACVLLVSLSGGECYTLPATSTLGVSVGCGA